MRNHGHIAMKLNKAIYRVLVFRRLLGDGDCAFAHPLNAAVRLPPLDICLLFAASALWVWRLLTAFLVLQRL